MIEAITLADRQVEHTSIKAGQRIKKLRILTKQWYLRYLTVTVSSTTM